MKDVWIFTILVKYVAVMVSFGFTFVIPAMEIIDELFFSNLTADIAAFLPYLVILVRFNRRRIQQSEFEHVAEETQPEPEKKSSHSNNDKN